MKITVDEFREKWLEFWRSKSHAIIPCSGVLPENDPSALFYNSGMHPLVPYLSGQAHPLGRRLANAQKCIRTIDIDQVGDSAHLTFFEMLGNWSLGDYFKKEQIEWSFEFLVEKLKIPREKLAVSVFAGDKNTPRDTESAKIWQECSIPKERIAYLGAEDNWWSKGETGPCGSDTEMFYWTGEEAAPANFQKTHTDPRWMEIWNDVFMEFSRNSKGMLEPLPQKNIDTGMGLERTVAVLNGKKSVFETDALLEIIREISRISGNEEIFANPAGSSEAQVSARIVADHLRASVVILSSGVFPSNTDQGYILRRLIRRAIRHGRNINISGKFSRKIAEIVIKKMGTFYSEILEKRKFILSELEREEELFLKTLETGEKELQKFLLKLKKGDNFSGKDAFYLYETYGFPFEITRELVEEKGFSLKKEDFDRAFTQHQKISKQGSQKKFKSGLRDTSEKTVALHTATHLLHSGLRKILGEGAQQRGSNITPERLRFDFSYPEKLSPRQMSEVEDFVNDAIKAKVAISCKESTVSDAQKSGAIGLFGHKYAERVTVYSIPNFSREICAGPHVKNTSELGRFKIIKEESSGRGVRRIKAVLD